ncbi:hypothetical protein [Intrasporangium chromatireducens]|uniref:hypothetical protein n=1 Tax=Intrasporangium chromatireducens TaxID=1386088 RepID=UPI001969F036|nr:hypothetical protein [Intrasporangium chromatireducens]
MARGAWDAADQDGRYLLTALATVHTRPGDALSHHAALAAHGLPLFGHDPTRVDVVSNVRQTVNRCGLWVHPVSGAGVVERLGVVVVRPARRSSAADANGDSGRDAGEAVWLEKRREDAIRRRGHPVERVIWRDLDRPARIGSRVRAARQLVSPAVLDPATRRAVATP